MGEETSEILQPGSDITPKITIDDSKKLLEKLYGLQCRTITELIAYDDKNYKVIVEDHCNNENIVKVCENGYVFKILNKHESKNVSLIEAQKDMMLYLDKNNIRCSKPVKNKEGKYFSLEKIENSGDHIIRLLEFIPGKMLCDVPATKELFFNAGEYLANLDLVLKNFYHVAYKTHRSTWMLESLSDINQFLHVISNDDDRKMIQEVITEFESNVLTNLGLLEKGSIHGDFNEHNIIVHQNQNGDWNINAILDFGDSQYSCLLFEIAIALTYMIIEGNDIKMGGHFLAGYSSLRRIPEYEYNLLKVSVAARFCQSLVMGAYTNSLHPDNTYVLSTQAAGWKLLRELWATDNDQLIGGWKNTVEFYSSYVSI